MLFDLDGVLARHDTFSEFVRRQVLRRPWLALPVGGTLPALVATALVPTWQGRPASWAARSAMLGGQVAELSEDLGALGSPPSRGGGSRRRWTRPRNTWGAGTASSS